MTPHRTINWALAAVIALLLSIVWDSPSDIEAAQAVADDLQAAIQTAQVAKP